MRQRLGLAATLLGDPEVLVLDEPANGLDPQGIRWLRDFLRSMASEGRTVLVSSHVLAEVAQTVDDVVVIHRGRLVDQGPVSRLTAGGHVVARSPRAAELQAALERAGLEVTVDGDMLVVGADDPARVGELAFEAGIPLHELTTRATSLEEAFLALTSDEEADHVIPLVHGEMIKVRTTRTALGLRYRLRAARAGRRADHDPRRRSRRRCRRRRTRSTSAAALCIPLLLFGIVGATGEYRHRTLAPAVLIAPDRMRLALARLVAYVLTALAVGIAMAVVALVVGVPLLASQPGPDLGGDDYRVIIGGGIVAAMLCTALGVGVGMVVKNQVAGVVGALVWLFILEPLIPLIDEWLANLSILGSAATLGGAEPDEGTWAGSLLVLGLWAAVFVAVGLAVERRRDVD